MTHESGQERLLHCFWEACSGASGLLKYADYMGWWLPHKKTLQGMECWVREAPSWTFWPTEALSCDAEYGRCAFSAVWRAQVGKAACLDSLAGRSLDL